MQKKKKRENGEHGGQLEELSHLTGALAHEIKNPLSTIKVNLRVIRDQLQELDFSESGKNNGNLEHCRSKVLRKITVIENETDRLEQILEGYLRYISRAELRPVSIDINELVSDMVDFYSPQAHSHKITIRQALCDEPLVCKADADMLKQAVLNLFINAQQAMSGGGELMIRTGRERKEAVIKVGDTGSGIAADKVGRIFDAYYSLRPHGSGLGLPTTKKIVNAHNGSISVNTEQGKGTLFTIKLPLEAD
jgi:signal transduction histidine kinase